MIIGNSSAAYLSMISTANSARSEGAQAPKGSASHAAQLLLLGGDQDEANDDKVDFLYDQFGRFPAQQALSDAQAAQSAWDEVGIGDESGHAVPIKYEIRVGDTIVARVYENGASVVANGFDLSSLDLENADLKGSELADSRFKMLEAFFKALATDIVARNPGTTLAVTTSTTTG